MRRNKAERKKLKNARQREQERKNKFSFRFITAFAVLFTIYIILKPSAIGSDLRYNLFVLALPAISGTALFYFYRNKFYNVDDDNDEAESEPFWHKAGYYAFILLIAVVLSLMSVVLIANIIFTTVNYYVALDNKPYEVIVPINQFSEQRKAGGNIYFTFNKETESVETSRENIRLYQAQSQFRNRLRLSLRKGIWNHYLVEDWEVIK